MLILGLQLICLTRSLVYQLDYGWLWFAPSGKEAFDKKREAELLNGRLAMIAVGGIATQSIVTGHGFPYV